MPDLDLGSDAYRDVTTAPPKLDRVSPAIVLGASVFLLAFVVWESLTSPQFVTKAGVVFYLAAGAIPSLGIGFGFRWLLNPRPLVKGRRGELKAYLLRVGWALLFGTAFYVIRNH